MKKLVLSLIVILLTTLSVEAQQNKQRGERMTPEEIAKKQTEEMTTALGLSSEQAQKVEAINLASATKQSEMRENNDGDREAMREAMQTMREERDAELKKVLTDEQYKKMQELEEERQSQRGERGQRGGGQRPSRN